MAQVPSKSDPGSVADNPPKDVDLDKETVGGFMPALPAREGWSATLVQYKNYWLKPRMLEGILLAEQAFKPRADDIILSTQPKCGTTWLKALAFTITNRSRYDFSNHPLRSWRSLVLARTTLA
jgi:estrone sulfotransferase